MADATSPPTLEQFAAAHPDNRARCVLCTVAPEIEQQARKGKQAGVTYRVLGQWLDTVVQDDHPITKGRLERHFQQDHKPDGAS